MILAPKPMFVRKTAVKKQQFEENTEILKVCLNDFCCLLKTEKNKSLMPFPPFSVLTKGGNPN